MRFKLNGFRIGLVIIAAMMPVVVAHYHDFLPYHWQTYASPDGTFSIELPGKPAVETTQMPLEGDGNITIHFINAASTGSRAYTCTYIELENANQKSPDQVLESARDGSLHKVQGTLLSQNQLMVQGFPGLEFQASARADSLMDSRMVLVGRRLYMIVAVAPDGQKTEPKTVQRMFDSFKLNPK